MPLTACYFQDGRQTECLDTEDAIADVLSGEDGLLWVDACETTDEDGEALRRLFSFHSLAVEDCVSTSIHSPKIDVFDSYIFFILHGINHVAESDVVDTAELAFFIGKNYVVTSHALPLHCIEDVRQAVSEGVHRMNRGADFFAHYIADALVDNVQPTIDRMVEVADVIEDEVLALRSRDILDAVMKLKRSALRVIRIMGPQREVLARLSEKDFRQISADCRIYFRNVYDHVVVVNELTQMTLAVSDTATATYLSTVANRQNDRVAVLSVVTTIFMPLSLLVGVYGMNFEFMPELTWRGSYFCVLAVIALTIPTMLIVFFLSGWVRLTPTRRATKGGFRVKADKLRGHLRSGVRLRPVRIRRRPPV